MTIRNRHPQDVDIHAVLDFRIPCYRPKTPSFYSRFLLTKHDNYKDGNEGLKDPGRINLIWWTDRDYD